MSGTILVPARHGQPPTLAEVTTSEARDLLRRGKAEIATDEDVRAAGLVIASDTQEAPLHPEIEAYQQDRKEQEAEKQQEAAEAAANESTKAETKAETKSKRRGK